MASSLKGPEPFDFAASDLATEWKQWRKRVTWFLLATRKEETDDEVKIGVVLTLLGKEGVRIYDSFVFTTAGDAKKLKPVLDKFDSFFKPLHSEVFERYKFRIRNQLPGESFDNWMLDLRGLVKNTNYTSLTAITIDDSMLRDQIVLGILDPTVREKLLIETDLTFAKACEIVRACEAARSQLQKIHPSTEVGTVHRLVSHQKPRGNSGQDGPFCEGCGRRHKADQCLAKNVVCYGCNQKGHYQRRCPNAGNANAKQETSRSQVNPRTNLKQETPQSQGRENLHTLESQAAAVPRDDTFFIAHTISSEKGKEWFESLSVEGVKFGFKLDSGASCNILPRASFQKLTSIISPSRELHLNPGPRVKNYGAGDGFLKVLGQQTWKVEHKGKIFELDFIVVDEPGQPPILGLPSLEKLDLIRRVNSIHAVPPSPDQLLAHPILEEFKDLFSGLGKLPVEHHIRLKTGANYVDPTVSAAGHLAFKVEDKVFAMIDEMVEREVLAWVTEPTEYVSRMVVVGKPNGDIRICMDPSQLNKAILRPHFAVPTATELFSKLNKARWFCNLDAASGFFQIPLDTESSFLCTRATPRGRVRFLRMPFGLVEAPEVYLQVMSELFGHLPGCHIYFDDFLIEGETFEQLLSNLRGVFVRCREVNLKIQFAKSRFFVQELPWIGHVIGQGVLKADPTKIEAIVNMPAPADKSALVRVLGMVTYLSKFSSNLSEFTLPLRNLLKEDAAWVWETQQQQLFDQLKEKMLSLPVLRLFDRDAPMVVSVDASPFGLGAALLQNNQPVAFASTTLTEIQTRYCQIEKETLAIVFGLESFRQYVYGNCVTVETDHKPLLGLLEKPIASSTSRIQRMRLQLMRFEFRLVYKPGKELYIADTLSRAPSSRLYETDVTQHCEDQVHSILDQVIPLPTTRSRWAAATEADDTLKLLKAILAAGWPEKKNLCPVQAKPFWLVRHDLIEADGLILFGNRVVVPMALRREVMEGVHDGHFGEVKSVLRARSAVYWPGCDDQIRNMVASCSTCQQYRHKNPSQPLYPVKLPDYPFQMLSADHFKFGGMDHLLVIDSYSKWPCAAPLKSLTASNTVAEMERIFTDFGTPEELMSDNAIFGSAEFRAFCSSHDVKQVTSSPEFPRSNGLIERHIQTVKERMLKMSEEGKTLCESLTAIRTTPVSSSLPSPAVLLQGRNFRGNLHFNPAALKPQFIPAEVVRENLQQRQSTAAFDHGKAHDSRCSSLMVGQRVRVFVNDWWQPGVVEKVCPEPNSYVIRLRDGRAFRRTRSAINLDQSTSAGFGAVLPSAGPNPHAAGTAAQPHGNARDREPNPHAAGTAAQPHGNARAFEQMSSAATAVGASVVTPGRSFATVVSGTPVPSPVPAHRTSSSRTLAPRRLDPCINAPKGPLLEQPSGSTRSGNSYLKQ